MQVEVLIGNVWGRVERPDLVPKLRPLVAYQPVPLPPVAAQRHVKEWFGRHGRMGAAEDHQRLRDSEEEVLYEMGLDWASFTRGVLENVLRQRGVYDGFVSKMDRLGRFPAGLLQHVSRALWRLGCTPVVRDTRSPCRTGEPLDGPPLWPHQEEAVQAVLAHQRGVVYLPPRSGKTRIAIALLAKLGLPALYLTPRRELVRQTVEAMREWLPVDAVEGLVGGKAKLGAKRRRLLPGRMVWVATPGTARSLPALQSRRVLIVDEFHHAAARTYREVSARCDAAYWRIGLTGTFFRADSAAMEMHGVLAHAIYHRTVGEMVDLGRLVPASIAMLRVGGRGVGTSYGASVTDHAPRNQLAAWAAKWLAARGRRTLVLTKEIAHAEALGALIPGSVQVDGRDGSRVRKALDDLEARQVAAVVGTSVIGEGVDVPAADALVYAAAGRSRVKVVQDTFRVLTASPGKKRAVIVDFADEHCSRHIRQAAHRLAIYRSEPAHEAQVMDPADFPEWLSAMEG